MSIVPLTKKIGLITAIVALWSAQAFAQQKDIDKKIEYQSEQLEKIRKDIRTYKNDLKKAESKERSILTRIDETERSISLTEKLITQLNREQNQKERDIIRTERSIQLLESNLATLKKNFAKRLVYLHKNGQYSDLELIMTARSVNQAFYRYKYLRILAEIDRNTYNTIKNNISAINQKKNQLKNELRDKEQILNEKNNLKNNLKQQKRNHDRQLAVARKDKSNIAAQIKEKERAAAEMSRLITNLEKERETRRKELERQRALSGVEADNPFLASKGRLNWPAKGEIISRFGIQKHPTLKTITDNSGIDIKVRLGSPVVSVLDGVVTTITYIRGFGNTIIIDHGSGFYSVYAHVENIRVSENDYVTTNSTIAEVGQSGSLSGPLLHFEIWRNKTKLNPEEWLNKR
ncbi:MAG: peptidoglycan DD-metalloendopeptidase family protein [Candidatus Marinimicrobia bacterium]|jgi:septal ring factor EnvC (AmiA/AmiB activator)|nr:peptidoglycan DD-metalloendopeptidase family protein [Candidatus Neomarinimicrobiota bacterium]MDD5063018.1 peptidoglycan DD-metalloendopeptidase family protein [Candidatus Neomarinimicrobiota bacterium]MDD5230218.1 peptidoglycan DD-metalloendopeptidase family protein [Candidatus Neomarinimicrobiota bacterium]MDD5540842.1 peptidoglycan DD-metalloendopeptidase family protein [Candidatus Neomarinimicrobiota bacterium]